MMRVQFCMDRFGGPLSPSTPTYVVDRDKPEEALRAGLARMLHEFVDMCSNPATCFQQIIVAFRVEPAVEGSELVKAISGLIRELGQVVEVIPEEPAKKSKKHG